MDLADVLAGLSVSPGVMAIVAAGVLVAAIHFATWLTDTVASFFDGNDADDEGEEEASAEWECDNCGFVHYDDDAVYWGGRGCCRKCGE